MKLNQILVMRPDFANTEYMNVLADEWSSHAFSVPTFSAEAAQEVSARSQETTPAENHRQMGNAGSLGQVEKDRAIA